MPISLPTAHAYSHLERSKLTERLAWEAHDAPDPARRDAAHREMVQLNIRVARAVAARYRDRGVSHEDLEQVACEALVKAVQRFDPTLHHDLLSYAVPTVRGEVLRHLRDLGWTVRPPRRLQELHWQMSTVTESLHQRLGREPTAAEVAAELGISPLEHDEAVLASMATRVASLDRPMTPGGSDRLGDLLADEIDHLGPAEARAMLEPLLRELDARDRRLLRLRFVEELTQREIGEELGVTQMQVSRWLTRICADLRSRLGTLEASVA